MNVKTEPAPIVLFVYNRIEHTKKTVNALLKNELADKSDLFIFSDAAKNMDSVEDVQEVRKYIKTIEGFNVVKVIEREYNFGLANSIIDGVSKIISKYGKVIVLEDDLITSKYFLYYMNKTLEFYQDDKRIFSITGFSFSTKFMKFPKEYQKDIYLNIRPMSWSWATWLDRWENVDWEVSDYHEFIKSKRKKNFNKGGPDLVRMLKAQMNGKIDSWYIRWTYDAYKKSLYTIYPRISYVNNIGHDNTGVHCKIDENEIFSHHELHQTSSLELEKNIELSQEIIHKFNSAFKINIKKKIKEKWFQLFSRG